MRTADDARRYPKAGDVFKLRTGEEVTVWSVNPGGLQIRRPWYNNLTRTRWTTFLRWAEKAEVLKVVE